MVDMVGVFMVSFYRSELSNYFHNLLNGMPTMQTMLHGGRTFLRLHPGFFSKVRDHKPSCMPRSRHLEQEALLELSTIEFGQ